MEPSASVPALVKAKAKKKMKMKKTRSTARHGSSGGRHKVELYSAEYWKVWKSKINLGPQVDPVAEAREAARVEAARAARRAEINARGFMYHHPNKGWIQGGKSVGGSVGGPGGGAGNAVGSDPDGGDGVITTRPVDEPDSLVAQALAGGRKVPLDYRPPNDHPSMVDLVGHNGDGVMGPFRSNYRGGPRKPRGTIFGRAARNDLALGTGSARVDVPFGTVPSTFGSRPMASSKMRTAQSVSFGSGTQHGSPVARGGGGAGPTVVAVPKNKQGGLFSGGGGIATQSLRPKGLGEPGPAGLCNESLVKPTVTVPQLGRSDRWGTAEYLEKSRRGAGADAMYNLPSYVGGAPAGKSRRHSPQK